MSLQLTDIASVPARSTELSITLSGFLQAPRQAGPDDAADRTLGRGGRSTSFRHRSEHHSTTPLIRSIRRRTEGGMLIPRIATILEFTTSSKRVGCSTGSSLGFAPLRTLSP